MKTLAGSLVLLSSLSLAAAGCGTEADDLTSTEDALLTCNGWHSDSNRHRGHRHHRHHHHGHGHGGGGGTQPHMTGSGGTTGAGGGMAGSTGMGGAPADPRCAPLDGIVSWWHADSDYDDAVGSNDGTTGGAASFGPGIDNQAFNLSGAPGAYVNVANSTSLDITGSITIDAWINQTSLGGRIVDKSTNDGGYMMDVVADRLRMSIGTDALLSGPLPAGQWVHVAGVFNGSGLGVYVNGALSVEGVTRGSAIMSTTVPLRMGADMFGGSNFIGMIDEPRVFNRALTADDINLLFWQGSNCQ